MAEEIPGVSTRRISVEFHILSHLAVQPVQSLQKVQQNRDLHRNILLTDKAQFTRDGINNYHNEHRWFDENPYATFERNFQHRFSIKVWCGLLDG